MPFVIGGRTGGGDFEKAPPGMHLGVCAAVYDVGIQVSEWKGEEKRSARFAIVWELQANDSTGKPYDIVDVLPCSLGLQSKAREACSALFRRAVSEDEELNPVELIGRCAMLTLAEGQKGGIYIERRDALQDPNQGLVVQGDYGPADEIHRLVAYHIKRALPDTCSDPVGRMPEPKTAGAKPAPQKATGGVATGPQDKTEQFKEPVAVIDDESMPF